MVLLGGIGPLGGWDQASAAIKQTPEVKVIQGPVSLGGKMERFLFLFGLVADCENKLS